MQCFKTQRFSKDLKDPRHLLAVFVFSVFCVHFTDIYAQHLRIYACAIANDSAGASMGGSSNGSGLYQSDDTGKTWKHLGWDNIKCYSMDMVQSSNGRILYEATGLGILRSTDYGEHWKQITDWRISEAMDVAVNQKNPNEIYIATEHGPWWTRDGGKKWGRYTHPVDIFSNDFIHQPYYRGYVERVLYDEKVMNTPWWFKNADNAEEGRAHSFRWKGTDRAMVEGTLRNGVIVNGTVTLPYRQIWTLKSFLVTP